MINFIKSSLIFRKCLVLGVLLLLSILVGIEYPINVITKLQLELDTDLDGVLDENDVCLNTEFGLEVNKTGCSKGQLDDDSDGVEN